MEIYYTIIIPHKNIPDLLKRCLRSIPMRNDLEVIVVDDNSDPSKVDFKHFPGLERPDTIVIFDKSGKGAGHARNLGIQRARGKKLLFADADDYFNYCLNRLLDQYKDDSSDIVFFKASSQDSETYLNANRDETINYFVDQYVHGNAIYENYLRFEFGMPWCKIVDKQMVYNNHITFEETPFHNDTRFGYLIGYYAKSIKADIHAIYCVTDRPNSIIKNYDRSKALIRISVFARKENFLHSHHIAFDDWYQYHIITLADLKNNAPEIYEKGLDVVSQRGLDKRDIAKRVETFIAEKEKAERHTKLYQRITKCLGFEIRKV